MKVIVDVCLSPRWVEFLAEDNIDALHWSAIGLVGARDREIAEWARNHGYIVLTHDLDFGAILALTRSSGPSVVQIRAQDVMPQAIRATVVRVLKAHARDLEAGALITVDEVGARLRILPIGRNSGNTQRI